MIIRAPIVTLLLLGCFGGGYGCAAPPQTGAPAAVQNKEKSTMAKERETLLQLTLDSDKVDRYFHVEERPERKPLRVLLNEAVGGKAALQKFGEAVVWVGSDETVQQPVFEFTSVKVNGDTAVVTFRYPPEGLRGTVEFKKQSGEWIVTSTRIVEQ